MGIWKRNGTPMENQQVDVDTLIAAVLSDGGEDDAVFKTYVACVGHLSGSIYSICVETPADCSNDRLTTVLFAAVHRHDEKTLQAVLADSRVRSIPKDSCSLGFGEGYAYCTRDEEIQLDDASRGGVSLLQYAAAVGAAGCTRAILEAGAETVELHG